VARLKESIPIGEKVPEHMHGVEVLVKSLENLKME
jgi:hypothetical protein